MRFYPFVGIPVWGMLSKPTGFLWMNERSDSPWYPTMRLFRQSEFGDWGSLIQEVRAALVQTCLII